MRDRIAMLAIARDATFMIMLCAAGLASSAYAQSTGTGVLKLPQDIEFKGSVPAGGRLRRSHPQGGEAGQPSSTSANQVRVGDQRKDGGVSQSTISRLAAPDPFEASAVGA